MSLASALGPLLRGDMLGWHGLPLVSPSEFEALFGPPTEVGRSELGYYPADRAAYNVRGGQMVVWARGGVAVMVEAPALPPITVLGDLEQPCAVLPQEQHLPQVYAHEHLYCARGLVLTVAQALDRRSDDRIVRARGIATLDGPDQFGPRLYKAVADQTLWSVP